MCHGAFKILNGKRRELQLPRHFLLKSRLCKHYSRNMKRSDDSEREKRRKRRRLLQELGDQRIPFLSPSDPGFQQLWESSYSGLALRPSSALPQSLHERVQSALFTLRRRGCLLRDLVRVRDRDVFTSVSRALLGQPGCTYRYLDTRLFAIPWHSKEVEESGQANTVACCDPDLSDACRALWELNSFFCQDIQHARAGDRDCKHREGKESKNREIEREIQEQPKEEVKVSICGKEQGEERKKEDEEMEKEEEEGDLDTGQGCSHSVSSPPHKPPPGPISFNITLLNYMDPTSMSQLKEEPYYGMGKMAVGWHHDENLVPLSPVAVYSYSCPSEKDTVEGDTTKAGTTGKGGEVAPVGETSGAGPSGSGAEGGDQGEGDSGEGESGEGESSTATGSGDAGEAADAGEAGNGERACWRVGLKVAWDIHTPGLTLPLQSGDCYYMTDDLNRTHQHCVLAGDTARFSSTHRVAQCSAGTLDYIKKRCTEALANLHMDPETGVKSLRSLQPVTLQNCEEIHNEVEFEWLRQYWFQGRRFARFCCWWSAPMEQLEKNWRQMEVMTQLLLGVVEDESTVQENRRDMAETLLTALSDRQQHRQTWRDRNAQLQCRRGQNRC
uniref:Alpha-ketoglutarate-dependent dioxygenase FTO n=1 Tax=Denticeps clupeoides TaxID=299321 RepID=A0AAY4EZH6_9TELE